MVIKCAIQPVGIFLTILFLKTPALALNYVDISPGRQVFYTSGGVPHIDNSGQFRTTYDPQKSFLPIGILYADPYNGNLLQFNKGGFNLAHIHPRISATDAVQEASGTDVKIVIDNRVDGVQNVPRVGTRNPRIGDRIIAMYNNNVRSIWENRDMDSADTLETHFIGPGNNGDQVIYLDHNNDGIDEPLTFRKTDGSVQRYTYNTQGSWIPHGSRVFLEDFDSTKDQLVAAGDFNGNGNEGIAIRYGVNNNSFRLYASATSTRAWKTMTYGKSSDEFLVGDWDGDGVDTYAIKRNNVYFLDDDWIPGGFRHVRKFGRSSDIGIAGDWNKDGRDWIGFIRPSHFNGRYLFYYISPNWTQYRKVISYEPHVEQCRSSEHVFGLYIADEPYADSATSDEQFDYLENLYGSWKQLTDKVLFHIGNIENGFNTSDFDRFVELGSATALDGYINGSFANTTLVAEGITRARIKNQKGKPLWYTVPSFDHTSPDFSETTPEEHRASVYIALVHGATGFWTFLHENNLNGVSTGIDPDEGLTALWQEVSKVNKEIHSLKAVILKETSNEIYKIRVNAETKVPPSDMPYPIRTLMKDMGTYRILIAVNLDTTNGAYWVDFHELPYFSKVRNFFTGDGVQGIGLSAQGSKFGTWFAPLQAKVFKLYK